MLVLHHVQLTASARAKSSTIQIHFNDARATQDAALNAPSGLLYKRTCYIPSDASSRAYDQQRPNMLWYVEAKEAYEPENCVHEGGR